MEREAGRGSHAILVAVSGGPDSVHLLHAAYEAWKPHHPRLVVASVDHGVRADSNEDVAFTARLAADLSLPFRALAADPSRVRKSGRVNEARLRSERYRLLSQAAREHGASALWLAHQRDDQVETVILAALRAGAKVGLAALAGMHPRRRLRDGTSRVRPLLRVPRGAILADLAQRGAAYRIDPSNRDERFLRNHVRHTLLPQLREELGPALDDHLFRLGRIARIQWWRAKRRAALLRVPARDYDALHARMTTLLAEHGVRPTHRFTRLAMERWIEGAAGRLEVARGLALCLGNPRVERVTPPSAIATRAVQRSCERADLGVRVLARLARPSRGPRQPRAVFLDSACIQGELRTRTRRAGDRMHLLHRQHPHKLKDLFAEAKVPRLDRNVAHVFEDDAGIVAVEGLGIARRVAVTATTRRVLAIHFVFDAAPRVR